MRNTKRQVRQQKQEQREEKQRQRQHKYEQHQEQIRDECLWMGWSVKEEAEAEEEAEYAGVGSEESSWSTDQSECGSEQSGDDVDTAHTVTNSNTRNTATTTAAARGLPHDSVMPMSTSTYVVPPNPLSHVIATHIDHLRTLRQQHLHLHQHIRQLREQRTKMQIQQRQHHETVNKLEPTQISPLQLEHVQSVTVLPSTVAPSTPVSHLTPHPVPPTHKPTRPSSSPAVRLARPSAAHVPIHSASSTHLTAQPKRTTTPAPVAAAPYAASPDPAPAPAPSRPWSAQRVSRPSSSTRTRPAPVRPFSAHDRLMRSRPGSAHANRARHLTEATSTPADAPALAATLIKSTNTSTVSLVSVSPILTQTIHQPHAQGQAQARPRPATATTYRNHVRTLATSTAHTRTSMYDILHSLFPDDARHDLEHDDISSSHEHDHVDAELVRYEQAVQTSVDRVREEQERVLEQEDAAVERDRRKKKPPHVEQQIQVHR